MKIVNIIKKVTLLIISTCCINTTMRAQPPMYGPAELPQMNPSPEDLEMMRQMDAYVQALPPDKRNEFEQGINYLNSLPPAEQEKYFQQLEKQTDFVLSRLDTMDPKEVERLMSNPTEFEDFVQKALVETAPETMPETAPQITPAEKKIDSDEINRQKALQNELKNLITLIDKCTESIDAFMVKAEQMHKLPASFTKWLKAHELTSSNASLSWEELKTNIEKLNKTLRALKAQDPEKKTYKYLTGLVTSETLQNNISHLLKVLQQNEPKFVTPTFGLGKLDKEARQALISILNAFIESFESLNLLAELEKLIEQYEPTAAEIKKAEKAAFEKAQRLSEQPVPEVYTEIPYQYGDRFYPGYEPSYEDYGMPGHHGGYQPTFKTPPSPADTFKGGKELPKEEKKAAGGAPKAPSAAKPEAEEAIKRLDTLTEEIIEAMSILEETVEESKSLKNMDKILFSKDAMGPRDTEIINTLSQIKKTLMHEVRGKIRGANVWMNQIKNPKVKDKYRKSFKGALNVKQLDALLKNIEKISKAKGSMTKERQYAYFGEGAFKAGEKVPAESIVMTELLDAQKALKDTIDKLGEPKKESAPLMPKKK